jgi:GNAT superfamily N-acetyltransferase
VPVFKMRRATVGDVEVLVEHRRMMFEEMTRPSAEALEAADDAYRAWAKENIKRRLFRGYIVTTRSGKIAASGCVWLREIQPSPYRHTKMVPYILSVYTRPEFRRKGLASMIVKEAMEWGRKKGYHKIVLHASTVGRKVYSQLGWKRAWEMEFRFERPPGPGRLKRGLSPRPSKRVRAST